MPRPPPQDGGGGGPPSWWTSHFNDDDQGDEALVSALLGGGGPEDTVNSVAPAQQARGGATMMDDGASGMPLAECYNGNLAELSEIDAEIKKITAHLREHGVTLAENMEGDDDDDDDEGKRKRFMTIADLPPSPFFFGAPEPKSAPVPDVSIERGRRLKDGALRTAFRAPGLGLGTPIYLSDAVGPALLFTGLAIMCFSFAMQRHARLAQRLKQAEESLAAERERANRMLEVLVFGRRAGV